MFKETVIPIGMFEKEKKYWLAKLSGGLSELRLITDSPRNKEYMRKIHKLFFEEEVVNHLKRISKNNDLSLYVLLLVSLKILLFKYTGQNEIILSSPIYDTDSRNYNQTVVFRDFIYPDMIFKEVLMAVKQTVADGYKNQYYPIDRILNLLDKGNKLCLNRVVLLFENIHSKKLADAIIDDFETDIMFSVREINGKLEVEMTYNAGIFKDETMQRLLNCYLHILGQVLSNTNISINHIELANEEEKKEILYNFNHTAAQYPRDKTISRLFAEQAERTPGNIAIYFGSDLNDIFEELESRETNIDLWDRMAKCHFKKNPFIFEASVNDSEEMAGYKLLKTHRHNSVVVNSNMAKVLDIFDGTRSLSVLFSFLQDLDLQLAIYSLKQQDVIELTYEFKNEPEKFFIKNKESFISLVKSIFKHHLIELTGFDLQETKREIPVSVNLRKEEHINVKIPLNSLLNQDKTFSNARVLFLGDTPGLQTVGLLYMASYLRRNGIKSYCQFYNTNWSDESLKKSIGILLKEIRPEIVAVSMKWFPHIARVLEICKIVKEFAVNERFYDIKVVVGGNTASYFAREIIACEWVDYVIRGDGEIPLLQLCRGEENISNCIYKKNGIIVENLFDYLEDEHNSDEVYLSHLDEIMLSRFAPLPGTFFIYTHKGCGMDCFYCGGCSSASKKIFNRTRLFRRGVEEVRKDISEAKKYTSTFMFDFDAPNVNLLEYCRNIWEGIDLSAHFCIFTNLIPPSPELMALVNQTFKYVYWNLDLTSLSERHRQQLYALGLVKPQPRDNEILAVFNECEKYDNTEIRINLIAGLPYFTMEDITLSDNMLSRILNRYTCCSELHWARLHAEPGAPVVENAEKYNMYSLASTFDDFLKYSRMNFNNKYNVEYYNYPYIYFKDEAFNSKISNFYSETNIKVEKYKKHNREKRNIYHRLSYLELNEKANRLARVLKEQGVTSNSIVGLMMRDPHDVAVGILGILTAGAAYLPIEPDIPGERQKYMIEDCNIKILLVDSLIPGKLGLSPSRLSIVPLSDRNPRNYSGTNLESTANPSDLAYVIYTSGTTGSPRGVLINHHGLVNYTCWRIHSYGLTEKDVTLEPLSYGFDGFGSNFYSSLLSGGTLIMISNSKKRDYQYIKEVVKKQGVTNISLVPGMYSVLVDIAEREDLKSLRFVVLAGERASKNLLDKSSEKNPHIRHINEYGPTEATVTAAARLHMEADNTAVIGKPIDNTRVYILDNKLNIIPAGVPGQLCIQGVGVARGYLNNPELTAQKFVRNVISHWSSVISSSKKLSKSSDDHFPMTNDRLEPIDYSHLTYFPHSPYSPYSTIYLTGDLARWLQGGEIEFLGRIDDQIKIRGFRIEVEEIELQLRRHKKVKDAAVIAWDISPGAGSGSSDNYLCAYIVSQETFDFTVLKEFLSAKLPEYMIPAYFVQLEKLPLTSNGKLDKKTLPLPEIKVECIAPRNGIEKKLVKIWVEVLGVDEDKIGINSNFFELGGHSLSANTAAAKIHKAFDVNNFLAQIFETPTIKCLAEKIKESVREDYYPIEPLEEKEYFQLSSAQKRLYVLQQMDSTNTSYNIPLTVPLENDVEKESLENIFRQLIKRHESLRTSFLLLNDEIPVQRIHREFKFNIEYYDLTDSPVENSAAYSPDNDILSDFVHPFDLSCGPLLRAALIRMPGNRCLLALDMHHIVTDGVSMEILVGDFESFYSGKGLPPLKLQYRDYAQWENSQMDGGKLSKQEKYWLKVFEDKKRIPVLNLPTDFPRPLILDFTGGSLEFTLDRQLIRILESLDSEGETTLYMKLLAIYTILLSKYSGQEDIIVGSPVSGRTHNDLKNIVGMFVNMLPMKIFPKGTLTFREFLSEVKNISINAFENQDYPFDTLVEQLKPEVAPGRHPLVETVFSFFDRGGKQDNSTGQPLQSDSEKNSFGVLNTAVKFDLKFSAENLPEGLVSNFDFRGSLFRQEKIARMIGHFKNLLENVVKNPDSKLSELEMLTQQEVEDLMIKVKSNNEPMNIKVSTEQHTLQEPGVKEGDFNF